jgi:hypothetical protein
MCGVEKVYCHLLERVRRQYGYVQNVPRHLTNVVELRPNQIVQTFIDFRTHTIKEPDWGELTGEATWQMKDGYILWYTRVSHPMILRFRQNYVSKHIRAGLCLKHLTCPEASASANS